MMSSRDHRPRYLPILKSRQGEMRALEAMTDPVDDHVMPVIELVEVDLEGLSEEELDQQLGKLVAKIRKAWQLGRPRIAIDCFGIEVESEGAGEQTGQGVITAGLIGRLGEVGVRAVPVIRLSDPEAYIDQFRRLSREREPGACLRIGGEDLDDALVPLDHAVEQLLERHHLRPAEVDLILDFGAVGDDSTLAMAARLARFVLPTLDREPWRSFALGAGGFPVNLAEVAAYTIAEIPRRDRQLWMQISGLRLRRPLDYSDYAVTNPLLQTGVAFAAPPQIRYTGRESWFVVKGRRTDRRGHAQFFELCSRLLREHSSEVAPAEFSWGDRRFHDAAISANSEVAVVGPGNASVWRAIATSHHIAHVLRALSTRGAP
jgi:hypothetical protein